MRVDPIYMSWLNNLGGFEYFYFNREKEYQVDIQETQTTRENIFPAWPNSYLPTADTIERKTYTQARYKVIVRSQHLTRNQRDVIALIKVSPVVQIIYSRTDRRTVIVDSESFKIYDEADSLYALQFSFVYTDNIPAQRA